ncbi:LysM peptidoglycan-binding domain-containing protein, partial [Candidatus Peregrinibacteria bacterium]|nr:LysM peptidoglycan-binding domain-containing protein [Candidatus Peregrinibacteria bacterium]
MPFPPSTPSSPKHWLSLHVRLVIVGALLCSLITPPYFPRETLAFHEEDAVELPQFLLVEDGFLMKSSSLTEQGTRRAYAQGIVHTVVEGENLERIAERYGISVDTIRWANKLEGSTPLKPGQELLILPVDGLLHIVTQGQTLEKIADLFAVPAEEIANQNQLRGSFILAGQELIIPGGRPIVTKPPKVAAKLESSAQRGEPREPKVAPAVPAASALPTRGVLQMPCNACLFTQYYHPGHYAVDLQTKGGGPVFAAEDGTVVRAAYGWNGGFGNVIEIDHGNG